MGRLKGKRVFISGPMTGVEHCNAPAFAEAHAICREQDAVRVFDPSWEWMCDEGEEKPHEWYMRRCLCELLSGYDMLLQLDGWEVSDGCAVEYEVALACGIEVVSLDEVLVES